MVSLQTSNDIITWII